MKYSVQINTVIYNEISAQSYTEMERLGWYVCDVSNNCNQSHRLKTLNKEQRFEYKY